MSSFLFFNGCIFSYKFLSDHCFCWIPLSFGILCLAFLFIYKYILISSVFFLCIPLIFFLFVFGVFGCSKCGFQVMLVVKNPSSNAEDLRDMSSIPVLGRFPEEGNNNPLQYSCLENPTDGGAWKATVHRVTKSWPWLKQFSTHTHEWAVSTYMWILQFLFCY